MASALGKRGSTRKWRKTRERVLKRDKGLCQQCLSHGRTRAAVEVDHIQRRKDGGGDTMDNLESLCGPCHEAKTRQENAGRVTGCDVNGIPYGSTWG